MEQTNKPAKNKGGRPKKDVVKNKRIPIKCTSYEKMVIAARAKSFHLTVSEYLLQKGMEGQIVSNIKTIPKEVLVFTGALNHIGANLNQLTKKHNSITGLTLFDRTNLLILVSEIKELVLKIKNHLQ